MTGWVILVDQPKDLPNAETPHKVITTSEYLARPRLFDMGRPKLVNLARSYGYQSKGYYASLLAEARGHRVMPTVETMLELREATLYEHALPKLEDELNRCARRADFQPEREFKLLVCFGIARDPRFESFGRLLFDWFRCPALEVNVESGAWLDRTHPPAQHHPARQRRSIIPARLAAPAHQARMARPEGAHRAEIRPRGAIRPQRKDGAVLARLDQAHGAHRRAAFGRRRAGDASPAFRDRRVRWPVHPRDHVDRQSHLPLCPPRLAGRHAGHRRPDFHDPVHKQGVPDGAPGPASGGDAADRDARRYRRHTESHGRTGPAAGGENSGRVVLAWRAQGEYAGGISPRRRRAVRGDRPPADAEILADRVRLARRRARGPAAVRMPVPHGARPLADRQAPPRRLLARGRLSHLRTRHGAARPDRHRGARRAPDRRRLLRRRHQGDRPRLHRHGGQRQSEPRARHRGPGRQGRDLDAAAQVVHRAVRAIAARREWCLHD